MKKNKLYRLTIGIPAYNEEQNIGYLINSILQQARSSYALEKIIVISDGSTDSTNTIVKRILKNNIRLLLVADNQRKGETERLNELFAMNKSDILIILDADVVLGKKYVLEELTQIFKNKEIAIVGLNAKALVSNNLVSKLINTWEKTWYEVRKNVNNGNNIYNIKGGAFAVKRVLIKDTKIPKNLQQVARYLYHYAKNKNYRFAFTKNALNPYRAPGNFKEYVSVLSRGDQVEMEFFKKTFGKIIYKEYSIPAYIKAKALLKMMLNNPILVISAFVFIKLANHSAVKKNSFEKPGIWATIPSTKKGLGVIFNL